MEETRIYIAVKRNKNMYSLLRTAEKRGLIIKFIEDDIKKYIKNLYGRNNVEVLKDENSYIFFDKDTKEILCRWFLDPIMNIVEG